MGDMPSTIMEVGVLWALGVPHRYLEVAVAGAMLEGWYSNGDPLAVLGCSLRKILE